MTPSLESAAADADVLLHFQRFGGHDDVATLQRHLGLEPLSLLHAAEIPSPQLTRLLESNFAGLYAGKNLVIQMAGDYRVRDRRYGLLMHTSVTEKQPGEAAFFRHLAGMQRFLRRKFLDDLRTGEKIFIYKSMTSDPPAAVEALHAALRTQCDATLLYVSLATPSHPPGTAHLVKPGLIYGYLRRILPSAQLTPAAIATQDWLSICQQTIALTEGAAPPVQTPSQRAALMLRFEGLGNTCEFGLVRRHFGAKAVGLLHWAATSLDTLPELIRAGFPGVGEPENVEVQLGGECFAVDKQYQLKMRTHARAEEADANELAAAHRRRVAQLLPRLREDLQSGAKIFVHATAAALPLEELQRLHRAMRRFGPATLLHIRPPEPNAPTGTLRQAEPGLFIGHLDRLAGRGALPHAAYDAWLALCRAVLAASQQTDQAA